MLRSTQLVDSATLYNKGLEVIEAHYLFAADNWGGQICAYLNSTQCLGQIEFIALRSLGLDLTSATGRAGGTMTGVLSAANETAVELFLSEKIAYLDIFKVVELTCDAHQKDLVVNPSLDEEIIHYDL